MLFRDFVWAHASNQLILAMIAQKFSYELTIVGIIYLLYGINMSALMNIDENRSLLSASS